MAVSDAISNAISHYPFDSDFTDSVGSNNLQDNNTVGIAVGKFGNCADFEASNQEYLNFGTIPANLQFGDTDFSIIMWGNVESSTSVDGILQTRNSAAFGEASYGITLNTTFQFTLGDGVGAQVLDSGVTPTIGEWYQLVLVHDSVNDQLRAYVNGTEYSEAYVLGTDASFGYWVLGRGLNSAQSFDGLIDDLVFTAYAMTLDDVTAIYNNGDGVAFSDWGTIGSGGGGNGKSDQKQKNKGKPRSTLGGNNGIGHIMRMKKRRSPRNGINWGIDLENDENVDRYINR